MVEWDRLRHAYGWATDMPEHLDTGVLHQGFLETFVGGFLTSVALSRGSDQL